MGVDISVEKLFCFMEEKHLSVLNKNPHNIMSIHISEIDDLLHSWAYGIISRYLIQGSTRYQVEGCAENIILDLEMSLDGGQRDNQGI